MRQSCPRIPALTSQCVAIHLWPLALQNTLLRQRLDDAQLLIQSLLQKVGPRPAPRPRDVEGIARVVDATVCNRLVALHVPVV
jgi:hypothetical protein